MCLLSYAINYYIENVLSALKKYTISAFKNNTVDSFDREKRWICAENDTGSTGWFWNMVRHNNMLTWDKNLTHNVDVNRFGAISCIIFYQNCIVSSLSEFKSFYHWPTLQTCRSLQLHADLSVYPKFWGYQVFIYSSYCSCHCRLPSEEATSGIPLI